MYLDEEIYIGEARGRISVSYDDAILLVLRRLPEDGLNFLQDMRGDDLWALTLRDKSILPQDLENLAYLTDLCCLDLGKMTLPDNYIDYIFPLRNLAELDLSGSATDRYQIEALAEITWLQCLKLGFLEKSQEREGWSWRDIRDALPTLNIRYGLMDVCDRWTRLATDIDAEFTPPISYAATDLIVPGPTLERRYKKWPIKLTCAYDTAFGDVVVTMEARVQPLKSTKLSFGVEDKHYRPAWERKLVNLYSSIAQSVGAKRKIKTGISSVDSNAAYLFSATEPQVLQMLLSVDRIAEILLRPDIVGDQSKFWKLVVSADTTKQTVSSVSFVHQVPFLEFQRLTSAKLRRLFSLIEDSLDHLLKIGVISN
ncbi:MAG: hypothetical protein KGS72_03125 [Cyanobacteria bacterium REEB67]|nr:hypothetical protein [Cyanobacteria bacterium REEB67]